MIFKKLETRKNLYIAIFMLLVLTLVLVFNLVQALPNPAAVYCDKMGYEYKTIYNENGENGACVFEDNEKCDEWDFLKGKCGHEHSFCSKNGFGIKVKDNQVYCVIGYETNGKLSSKEVPLTELVNLEESDCGTEKKETQQRLNYNSNPGKGNPKINLDSRLRPKELGFGDKQFESYDSENFSYWDWRNPPNGTNYSRYNYTFFDTNFGWVTSVKNQGACGSCWAFGTVANLESKYELNQNNSRLNTNLSEQHEVSCDHECFDPPYQLTCNLGCGRGWMNLALEYIKNNFVVDESCFPYTTSNNNCSNRCSDYTSRQWNISDYYTNVDGIPPSYNLTIEELEQMLLDNGPLIIGVMSTDDWSSYAGGLFTDFTCDNNSFDWFDINHAVLLVGYNDSGNDSTSYWIAKNSWGAGWGESGYINIRFNCNLVGLEAEYPTQVNPPNFKPIIVLNSPENGSSNYYGSESSFNFSVLNKNSSTATCDLIIDNIVNKTNSSVFNNTATIFNVTLGIGNHQWSIDCWETALGIVNSSGARNLKVYAVNVTLVSPTDGFSSNQSSRNFTCNASSLNSLVNATFYLWNSSSLIYNYTKNVSGIQNQSIFNYTFSQENNYSWNCKVFDNQSNSDFSLSNFSFRYDISNPALNVLSPVNNSYYNALKFNLSSDETLSSCWFNLNFSNTSIIKLNDTYFYYYEDYSDGTWNVTFYCNDSAGNVNISGEYFFSIEKVNPEISLNLPEDGADSYSPVDFNFNASDGLNFSGCEVILTGSSNSNIQNQSIIVNDSVNVISGELSLGDYVWKVNCSDVAGNEGSSDPRTLTIKSGGGRRGGGGGTNSNSNNSNLTNSTNSSSLNNQTNQTQNLGNQSVDVSMNYTKNESSNKSNIFQHGKKSSTLLDKNSYFYLIVAGILIIIGIFIVLAK